MRLAIAILFCLHFFSVSSQTGKGSIMSNFNGSVTHYEYAGTKGIFGSAAIESGYAFFDNFFLGVKYQPEYMLNLGGESRLSIPGYGLFGRYYFLENRNRIYLHTDFNHLKSIGGSYAQRGNAAVGFSRFLSPNVAVEAHFNYNYLNQFRFFHSLNPGNPDPIITDFNEPEGLQIFLQLQYFIPAKGTTLVKSDRQPLVERYLKKGNRYVYVSGEIYHENPGFLGNLETTKFLSDGLRMQHRFFGFGSFGKNVRLGGIAVYLPTLEPYFPIANRLYVTPSAGIGPTVTFFDNFEWNDLGWIATAQAGLSYFLKNAQLRTGYTFYISDFLSPYSDVFTTSHWYLSGEFFLSEQLSVRPEAFFNVHGDYIRFFRFENERFIEARNWRFQFGLSYYY